MGVIAQIPPTTGPGGATTLYRFHSTVIRPAIGKGCELSGATSADRSRRT